MPQVDSIFTFAKEKPPVENTPPAPAPAPAPNGTDITSQLADIRKKLDSITKPGAQTTPEQKEQAKKISLSLDPSKFAETDPAVIKELQANFVDNLNAELATIANSGSSVEPKVDAIDKKLNILSEGLQKITDMNVKREQQQALQQKQQAILNAVPELPNLLKDSEFGEFVSKPIADGAELTVGQILHAAEQSGDIGTIKHYVTQFLSSKKDVNGALPVTPPTQSQGASAGEPSVQPEQLSSLRHSLRSGQKSRKEIFETINAFNN